MREQRYLRRRLEQLRETDVRKRRSISECSSALSSHSSSSENGNCQYNMNMHLLITKYVFCLDAFEGEGEGEEGLGVASAEEKNVIVLFSRLGDMP